MRCLTLMLLLGGALPAQTWNWRQPNLPQYFKQFKLPLEKPPAKFVLAPGQKCAIPLLKVPAKDPNDPMVYHAAPSKSPGGPLTVSPPAPSCDDVR